MRRNPYPISMGEWRNARIERPINPITGLVEGDDAGYRNMATLGHNRSPLVIPDVMIRGCYDGTDEYGERRADIALPGGVEGGKLLLRQTVAFGIQLLDQLVYEASDGEFIVAALDGFRSERRQAAGFTRLLRQQMDLLGVTDGNHVERLPDFMRCSRTADGTFSWVRLAASEQLEAAKKQLDEDATFKERLTDWLLADLQMNDIRDLRAQDYMQGVKEYLTVSANSGIGIGGGLALKSECNAHAGGGACDVFVVDRETGKPMNIVPFDYPGPEAGMDFMEGEGAFDRYLAAAEKNPLLKAHLQKLGTTVSAFSLADWERIREAIRILYHAAKGAGFTYYSSDHGGENWHLEPGNIIYEPSTGGVVAFEALTAELHPDSGNPGHTLQRLGKNAVAVWGGSTAHEIARQNHGLQ